jgi:catechol 2,3-dioxygenase-like lactoylglutathione lyase family enzyme
MDGNTSFIIMPVHDMQSALAFYRDQLGLIEAWREGKSSVAFQLPNTDVQLLVSLVERGSPLTAGPGFIIPSADEFYAAHQGKLDFLSAPVDTPPGRLVIAKDPAGNTLQFLSIRHAE